MDIGHIVLGFIASYFYFRIMQYKRENKEINDKWGREVNSYQMTVNNLKNKSK